MSNLNDDNLQLLQEQLDFFQREYIISADPGRKFELKKRIEEVKKQIQEFEDIATSPQVANKFRNINLTGTQRKQFREAIIDAFPSVTQLEIMLSEELDWRLAKIAGGSNYEEIVFNLIKWAESYNEVGNLLKAAKSANPGNQNLHHFYLSIMNS
ncbi:MAG: effector-associated domain EAD1-containing protein [Scytonema sp. PMC 1069.18]|nr:effector-associated domain EAD1-containing protein [Scytonema sp. PMC 1069.18]MEC4882612.1 effector-associated domain EAD1-containing protein [Scytonema sp. PMC 1070.18]